MFTIPSKVFYMASGFCISYAILCACAHKIEFIPFILVGIYDYFLAEHLAKKKGL